MDIVKRLIFWASEFRGKGSEEDKVSDVMSEAWEDIERLRGEYEDSREEYEIVSDKLEEVEDQLRVYVKERREAADEIERLREEVEHLHKMTVKWSVLQVEGSQEIQRLRENAKRDAKYMLAIRRMRQTRGNEFMEAFDQAVKLYEDEQPAKATGGE